MATVIELKYDPQALSMGMKKAADAVRATAATMTGLGTSASTASKNVYSLSQETYKLASAGDVAQKEVFSLRKTIDDMTANAPAGIRKMRDEMVRFKDEAAKARSEARLSGQFGAGSGAGTGDAASGLKSARARQAASGGGVGGGEFLGSAIAGGLGLNALGLSGEALKIVIPNLMKFAGLVAKLGTGIGAVTAIVGSAVSVWDNLTKKVQGTVGEWNLAGKAVLQLGEVLGTFRTGTLAGLAEDAKEIDRWSKARVSGARPFGKDEQRQMDIETRTAAMSTPEARTQAAWLKQNTILEGRWQAQEKREGQRAELARRTEEKVLQYARIRDQGMEAIERSRARREQKEADDRVRRAAETETRIRKAQEFAANVKDLAGDQGAMGQFLRGAVGGADPKAVAKSTGQRRRMLVGDAAQYNRYLRNEELEKAEKEINERFSGAGGTENTVADRARAMRQAMAGAAKRERERNRVSRRDIGREMNSPAEQARAQGEVASEAVKASASAAGMGKQSVATLTAAAQEIAKLNAEVATATAKLAQLERFLKEPKARAKAQRAGRN